MKSFTDQEDQSIPEYLSQLEETVLEELSVRERNYSFRFNGLRRLLNDVHQQKLARALERLQEDNLIERYPDGGYGLDNKYYDRIKEKFGKQSLNNGTFGFKQNNHQNFTTISTGKDFPVQIIINKLTGKYFGQYRFIGHYFSNGKGRLEWIHAENQSKILITQISPQKIEISASNVSKLAIERFLRIIQQILYELHIIAQFSGDTHSQAN